MVAPFSQTDIGWFRQPPGGGDKDGEKRKFVFISTKQLANKILTTFSAQIRGTSVAIIAFIAWSSIARGRTTTTAHERKKRNT